MRRTFRTRNFRLLESLFLGPCSDHLISTEGFSFFFFNEPKYDN